MGYGLWMRRHELVVGGLAFVGFRIRGLGLRVEGLEFRVQG